MNKSIAIVSIVAVTFLLAFWMYLHTNTNRFQMNHSIVLDKQTGEVWEIRNRGLVPISKAKSISEYSDIKQAKQAGYSENEIIDYLDNNHSLTPLQKFRMKYPEYNDLSEEQLADTLYKKYYSDMPRAEYDRKIFSR